MTARTHVRIYSRRACSLCDAVVELIREYEHTHPMDIEIVDIDSDPKLFGEFDTEVPVVEINGREVARYRLTRERLLQSLSSDNDTTKT